MSQRSVSQSVRLEIGTRVRTTTQGYLRKQYEGQTGYITSVDQYGNYLVLFDDDTLNLSPPPDPVTGRSMRVINEAVIPEQFVINEEVLPWDSK